MKNLKTITLVILLSFAFTRTNAQYSLTANDIEISFGKIYKCGKIFSSTEKDIIIPDTINGQVVKEIYPDVFTGKGLKSVKFPAMLKVIGKRAFYDNELSSLDFATAVSLQHIEDSAFCNNELTELNMKNCVNINTIMEGAFRNNNFNAVNSTL